LEDSYGKKGGDINYIKRQLFTICNRVSEIKKYIIVIPVHNPEYTMDVWMVFSDTRFRIQNTQA
jgi:hypothetical protein